MQGKAPSNPPQHALQLSLSETNPPGSPSVPWASCGPFSAARVKDLCPGERWDWSCVCRTLLVPSSSDDCTSVRLWVCTVVCVPFTQPPSEEGGGPQKRPDSSRQGPPGNEPPRHPAATVTSAQLEKRCASDCTQTAESLRMVTGAPVQHIQDKDTTA